MRVVTAKVANIKTSSEDSIQPPPSLRYFEIAELLADLKSLDRREGKEAYILRQVATHNDEMKLTWICLKDPELLDQQNRDVELVKLVHSTIYFYFPC